jgi:hypothetical protein
VVALLNTACRNEVSAGLVVIWLMLLKNAVMSAPMPEVVLENSVCTCCIALDCASE